MHLIEACGAAGSLATIARYRALGHDSIPVRGPLAALTVPGTIGGWALALEARARRSAGACRCRICSRTPSAMPGDGYPVSGSETRASWREAEALEGGARLRRDIPGRRRKAEGRPAAARPRCLPTRSTQIGHAGLDDFYRGDVGREIAADLERIGAPSRAPISSATGPQLATPLSLGSTASPSSTRRRRRSGLASLHHPRRSSSGSTSANATASPMCTASSRRRSAPWRSAPPRDRFRPDDASTRRISSQPAAVEREAAAIDMRRAAALRLEAGRGRHDLDGRHRRRTAWRSR